MERDMRIKEHDIDRFVTFLWEEEKARATIEKYRRDVKTFADFAGQQPLTKELCSIYKERLCEKYKPASANSILSSLNRFLDFIGCPQLKLKKLKIQRKIFCAKEEELTKVEYERLVKTARANGNERLALILETICATGIRVSELKYITTAALRDKNAEIRLKGKVRSILLPEDLIKKLRKYCKAHGVGGGYVFVTKGGKPVDRSNIWREMKALCREAGVAGRKVFPHNLRHLFARTYYAIEKDLNRLADILGHSSIETTRIYTMISAQNQRKKIERLGLVLAEHNIM